jgi:hypothetical protein
MQTKAAQIAELLTGRKVFYVNLEVPDGKGSITEQTIEDAAGLTYITTGPVLTFQSPSKALSFEILENTEIITNTKDNTHIIVTLAKNGGLQINSA